MVMTQPITDEQIEAIEAGPQRMIGADDFVVGGATLRSLIARIRAAEVRMDEAERLLRLGVALVSGEMGKGSYRLMRASDFKRDTARFLNREKDG